MLACALIAPVLGALPVASRCLTLPAGRPVAPGCAVADATGSWDSHTFVRCASACPFGLCLQRAFGLVGNLASNSGPDLGSLSSDSGFGSALFRVSILLGTSDLASTGRRRWGDDTGCRWNYRILTRCKRLTGMHSIREYAARRRVGYSPCERKWPVET